VTLACGVALADCLATHGAIVQLKWPNDVLADGRKLAGTLSELVADRDMRHTLIVGVGVNWHLDSDARRAIAQPIAALDEVLSLRNDQRERWIGRLGSAVLGAVGRFMHDGFAPFHARFNQLLAARGEMVDVLDADHSAQRMILSGRVLEVDRSGCLIIDADGVHHTISSGDVSVRAKC
jgi:BirA family biotin operon repressor/biotin-[acetyl-CoA-carboxylase] ligase